MGKKKLLRKVENKVKQYIQSRIDLILMVLNASQSFTAAIVTLNTQGSRLIVGDMQESIYFAVYKAPENRLLVFADDTQPRWITSATMVDYNTVVAGDRFSTLR